MWLSSRKKKMAILVVCHLLPLYCLPDTFPLFPTPLPPICLLSFLITALGDYHAIWTVERRGSGAEQDGGGEEILV